MEGGWEVECEDEVAAWLQSLDDRDFGRAAFYIDLLESQGVLLDEPYTRQLSGKLRELRFNLGDVAQRISYFFRSDGRVVLLTVFRKQRRQERREIARAQRAMEKCLAEHGLTGGDG